MKTVILTTIILLSNLLLNLPSQAQCHIDDWTALKALYESTDGTSCSVLQFCTQTINLNAGWNLISFDLTPENTLIDSVFNNLQPDNLNFVTSYENGAVINEANGPPFLNTLNTITDGFAYWVNVQNDDVLTVSGACIEDNYIRPLNSFWNLVAFTPNDPLSPSEYFADLISNEYLEFVAGYDNGILQYNPNDPPFLNTLQQMENGFGYWVYLNTGLGKTTLNQTNIFSFINGICNLPKGEVVEVLNKEKEVIATLKVVEGNHLMTTPIYGDDLTTTFKEGISKGEKLRFSWNKQLAAVSTTFKGDYGVEKMQLEFKTDALNAAEFKLYPNPANGIVNISLNFETSTASKLMVYDLTGKVVKQEIFKDNNTNLNLSNVAKGMYIIKIQNGENLCMQKLIVE